MNEPIHIVLDLNINHVQALLDSTMPPPWGNPLYIAIFVALFVGVLVGIYIGRSTSR